MNVIGTFRLLQAALKHGVQRIVNASTGGAILGEATAPVNEEMPARPLSPYGASKLAVEGYMSAFAASYNLSTISLRFSNIYGPRSFHKGSVIANFIKKILAERYLTVYGDGSQVRDYLYTEDLVRAIQGAIVSTRSGVYQLGSGLPTSLNELISVLRLVTGRKIEVVHEDFRAGEVHTTWSDISKAKAELAFEPCISLEVGVANTWNWFQIAPHHS